MYNFAVVIDDYDMKITHIIRGEEHISNTPYQIAIRDALGFANSKVEYGHISLIVGKDGKKLSKRDQTLHQFIQNYRDLGFFPHAVTNFLALLGWSPKTNVEILSMEQLIKDFDVDRVSKSPCFFDFDRMK
jgi:glutamyl-tRNA synthetase